MNTSQLRLLDGLNEAEPLEVVQRRFKKFKKS